MPTLFHQDVTTPQAPTPRHWIYLLHGILGQGGNLRSVARRWIEERPDTGAVLVDLRLHGRSQDQPPPDTLAACAEDVEALASALQRPLRSVLGHSFGGKVAMQLAARNESIQELWVLDSLPGTRPDGTRSEDTLGVLEVLDSLPPRFASREEFLEAVQAKGLSTSIAQWLAMNVKRDGEHFRLITDLGRVRSLLDDYFDQDLWSVLEAPRAAHTHLVVGGRSDVLNADDRARAARAAEAAPGHVQVHTLAEAGHWLHAEAPDALHALLVGFPPAR